MDRNIRNYGSLDGHLAKAAITSSLSNKVYSYSVLGSNPEVDTTTLEDVWGPGGRLQYLSAASILTIVSTSASDTVGGAGIEYVIVRGLDGNYIPISETVALNGITPVNTVNSYLRVFEVIASKPNATDPNVTAVGTITASAGAVLQAQIAVGDNISTLSMTTIPLGYTGFITQAHTSGGVNDAFILAFGTRIPDEIFVYGNDVEISGTFAAISFDPFVGNLKEKTDVKVVAKANAQNAQVRINYTVQLIENKFLQSLANSF